MIGAFLGVWALPVVIMISAGLGSIVGLIQVGLQGPGLKGRWRIHSLPYGPFLVVGTYCYLFWGGRLLTWLSGSP
jgi:leader peptidase (prepilin peptidase)/N-methyltransferase